MLNFFENHWKTIAIAAAATAAFVAVSVLTAGLAPAVLGVVAGGGWATLIGITAGGAASGATGYLLGQFLNDRPITAAGLLTATAVSTILSIATLGIGSRLTPLVTRLIAPAVEALPVSAALASTGTRALTNAAVGTGLGAGTQVATNAITGRPLSENVGQASVVAGVTGTLMAPVQASISAALVPRAVPVEVPLTPTEVVPTGPAGRSSSIGMAKAIEDMNAGDGSPSGANGSPSGGKSGAATDARPDGLTHLKSADGYDRMVERGNIRGKSGIYALTDKAVDGSSTPERVLRTGISASATTNPVRLPTSVNPHFRQVQPIGPYSFVKWLGGTRYAPPGEININTGEYTPTPGQGWRPIVTLYGPDALINTLAAAGFGLKAYQDHADNAAVGQPAPAPAAPVVRAAPAKKPLPNPGE